MSTPDNLYQRAGVWWIRYNVNGRKERRSLGTRSQREATRLRNEILGTRDAGADVRARFGIAATPSDAGAPMPTFSQVAVQFLRHKRASSIRDQTYVQVAGFVNNWLVPWFGPRPIGAILPDDVVDFLAHLKRAKGKKGGRQLDENHRAAIFRSLKRVFRWARRKRLYVGADPCDIDSDARPRTRQRERPVLNHEQAQELLTELAAADVQVDQLRRMAALALSTGLRWGELCGLSWSNLDLDGDRPSLKVQRSYQGPPKNDSARQPVYLDPWIAAQLRQWRAVFGGEWVFVSKLGTPYKRMSGPDRARVRAVAREVGLADWEHFTPHCFRHTFGSWEYERTGDAKYVQRAMRHARIETTLRVYVHDRRDDAEIAARRPGVGTVAVRLRAV